jgi:dihydroflavonol-4-reductase
MATQATILVTGGTGFVGRYVVRALLLEGRKVRVLCRTPAKAQALFGDAVEVAAGDLQNPAALASACRGASRVFHLAGLYEFGARYRQAMWQTNVLGTQNLLSACWYARVERVVHCSTAGILKPNGEAPAPPDFPDLPPAGCHYKRSKWESERAALEWAGRGLPVMIASPTALLGAEDERPTPTGRTVVDMLAGRFPCYTRTGINVIAVEDVASGILAIAERGRTGDRYVLANQNLWLGELLQIIARVANLKAPRVVVPWPIITLAGWAGEAWGLVSGASNSRLCRETAVMSRRRQFFNFAATTAALGWVPRKSVESAVADAVAWARQHQLGIPVANPPPTTAPTAS